MKAHTFNLPEAEIAVTIDGYYITDEHDWLVDITLLDSGKYLNEWFDEDDGSAVIDYIVKHVKLTENELNYIEDIVVEVMNYGEDIAWAEERNAMRKIGE